MANTHSFSELHYGFDRVFSNVPVVRLSQLWPLVEEANRTEQEPFLQPGQNYVVVDLNRFHLQGMLERITADALREFTCGGLAERFVHEERKARRYPHHTTDTVVHYYQAQNGDGEPDVTVIYGRVKNRDSLTEKVTRLFAENGQVHNQWVDHSLGGERRHVGVDDCYGVTFVCRNDELAYAVQERLHKVPYLVPLISRDFITQPKPSGYRALHDKFVFVDGVKDAYGLLLETHIETKDDALQNREGDGNGSGRDHHSYSWRKLRETPHSTGNNQIIIFEKNGHDHEELIPVQLKNRFTEYVLINY